MLVGGARGTPASGAAAAAVAAGEEAAASAARVGSASKESPISEERGEGVVRGVMVQGFADPAPQIK